MPEDAASRGPAFDLSVLRDPPSMTLFTDALDWAVDGILRWQPDGPGIGEDG